MSDRRTNNQQTGQSFITYMLLLVVVVRLAFFSGPEIKRMVRTNNSPVYDTRPGFMPVDGDGNPTE